MTGYLGRQDGALLPSWDYLLCPKRKQCWPTLASEDGWKLAKFFSCMFMDCNSISVHKNAKDLGQYLTILTSHLVNETITQYINACNRILKQVCTRKTTLHELQQMRRANTDHNWQEKPTIMGNWEIFISWIPHSLPQPISMWYNFLQSHKNRLQTNLTLF